MRIFVHDIVKEKIRTTSRYIQARDHGMTYATI